jgi:hypothetical protein
MPSAAARSEQRIDLLTSAPSQILAHSLPRGWGLPFTDLRTCIENCSFGETVKALGPDGDLALGARHVGHCIHGVHG